MATANKFLEQPLFFMLGVKHSNGRFDVGHKRSRVFGSAFSGQFVGCGAGHIKGNAPILYTQGSAINRHPPIESGITCLFSFGGPSTILGFVISIIVDAINGVKWGWFWSHIFHKSIKTIHPSLANLDTSTTVNRKFMMDRVVAPLLHGSPCLVFKRLSHVMGALVGVTSQQVGRCLFGQTAAAKRAFSDIGSSGDGHSATVALAMPHGVPATFWARGATNNKKSTELFACNIKGFWHLTSTKYIYCKMG